MTRGLEHATAPSPVRRHWLTLRVRLTLWMVLIALVIQLCLSAVAFFYERGAVEDFFQARFRVRARNTIEAVRRADCRVTDDDLRAINGFNLLYQMPESWSISVYDDRGELLAATHRPALPSSEFDFETALVRSFPTSIRRAVPPESAIDGDAIMRVGASRVEDSAGRPFVVLVAGGDTYFERMMRMSAQMLLFTLPAGVIAAAAGGWMIAGLAVSPFLRLREVAHSIMPEIPGMPLPEANGSREPAALEADLNDARDRLRRALLAQERFISNVSHELKTPIAVLLTEAQTLPHSELSPEARSFARSVTEEMRLLARMVESFLTLTMVRGGRTMTRSRPCNLNDIAMEATEASRKMASQYGVRLAPRLWEHEAAPIVSGDPDLLRVMVDNLIRNAIRFSPEGDQIGVAVRTLGEQAEVSVRDQGPGVPAELIDNLFDRFVQSSDEVQKGRGHGLGLSIAQGIAELHGGKIRVRNQGDGGCEFTIGLPLAGRTPPAR